MTGLLAPPVEQLQLLLTERCNLRCTHCAVPEEDSPAEEELTLKEWQAFLVTVMAEGIHRIVLSGGEALLRRECLDLAESALVRGASQVVIVTNGTVFSPVTTSRLVALQRRYSTLDVHVSIDGATPDTHDAIRGRGTFARTLRGIERLRAAGGRIDGVHTVVHRDNRAQLVAARDLVISLGARSWTVFPVAALGRGVNLDHLRLDRETWTEILATLSGWDRPDLTIAVMGPIYGDEWPASSEVPRPRREHSPQACVGPDGHIFSCPPLRGTSLATVREIASTGWAAPAAALQRLLGTACPACKYRPLCTGVDPAALVALPNGAGEPTAPASPDPVRTA